MKDRIKKSLLSITGSNLKVSESSKSIDKKRKRRFIDIIEMMKEINSRSRRVHEEYGIDLFGYEDPHYQIFENLLEELYGASVCRVIFWWVYEVENPNKFDYRITDDITNEEYPVKTTTQLYNILKKLKLFK
tara:strand:- start:2525 stop:2920 length:396 start_codon:yes stop_codon:yes gene_type:complete